MNHTKFRGLIIVLILCIGITPLSTNNAIETDSNCYTVSGTVFDENGAIAGATSIQLSGTGDSAWNADSVWTVNGEYEVVNETGEPCVPGGEYNIRAYYMDNGHTVSYRKIIVDTNIDLDWVVANNWATINSDDHTALFKIAGNQLTEEKSHSELVEFGPFEIGNYYNIAATHGDDVSHSIVFKMEAGSPVNKQPNHFVMDIGTNSHFGYVKDFDGNPMENVEVLMGNKTTLTNSDGFYLINGLNIGETVNVSAKQGGVQLINQYSTTIGEGLGWYNLTSEIAPNMPDEPSFLTSSFDKQIDDSEETIIRWIGGDYTDYFELHANGELKYRGTKNFHIFNPNEVGTYEFVITAVNLNGSTEALKTISAVIIGPTQTGFWDVGMNWEYQVDYTPASSRGTHTMTMTTLGTEIVTDAFGIDQQCFLMKVVDDYDSDDQVRYYYIDTDNLMKVKTYSETSSYYVLGTMGWNYTTDNGDTTDLLTATEPSFNAHFNRTNIIGVPGHPDGYDDTQNLVTVTDNVVIETPMGNFSTTYYKITDLKDNIASWELWYNETVRNWIKIVDRLPGSHSESVEYLISNYSGIPDRPQFVTESSSLGIDTYQIEWGQFGRAESYVLVENGIEIYNGSETNFVFVEKPDGTYSYTVTAKLPSGSLVASESITIDIDYVVQPPRLKLPYAQNLTDNDELMVEWTKSPYAVWYSLYHAKSDGIMIEIYNGSATSFLVEDLSEGQNRFRVGAGIADGKYSELSESSYVNYSPSSEDDGLLPFMSFANLAILLIIVVIINRNKT